VSRSPLRRLLTASIALATTVALAVAGLLVPTIAHAASTEVTDAVFRWGLNEETGSGAFAPGTYNLLSAGAVEAVSADDPVTSSNWRQSAGAVEILKRQADGGYADATFDGLRTNASGQPVDTNGITSGHVVQISGGTGEVDPDAGTATIRWTGTFTVAYHSGTSRFWVVDPLLRVDADGTGTVTATLGGYRTSMEDPTRFEALDPVPGIVVAQLSGVTVGTDGIETTPLYRGVEVAVGDTPQLRTGADWGAFPQSFVDFQQQAGQSSYWYSSGLSSDARKVAAPISIDYEPSPPVEVLSDAASFEFGVSPNYQVAALNGQCSPFLAGFGDGTYDDYRTTDEDLVLIKRDARGRAFAVDEANRCAQIEADGQVNQRALWQNGHAERDTATGVVTIAWHGTMTAYAYGGLVPWSVSDPVLTIEPDGTGRVTADLAGYSSSMDDPDVKVPLAPETGRTVLDLKDVSIGEDGTIASTPLYEGVDYFPLVDYSDPSNGRSTTSAVNKIDGWGSWPTDFVDFQYRTGLSTYWHTSTASSNSGKGPLPIGLSLSPVGYADADAFETVTITQEPVGPSQAIVGGEAIFTAAAESSGDSPVTYQWERVVDGVWTPIDGATDATLTLGDLTVDDDGARLRVRVSNGVQSYHSTNQVTLAVEPEQAVSFATQPVDASVFPGADVTLSAVADGWPTPVYQWQQSVDGGETWTDYGSSSTSGTLSIARADDDLDGSRFRAVATNGRTDATSDPAVVRFDAAATFEITQQPQSYIAPQKPAAGAPSVQLGVVAAAVGGDGDAEFAYQWQEYDAAAGAWVDVESSGQYDFLTVSTDGPENDGARHRVKVTLDGQTITSQETRLTIVPGKAPRLTGVVSQLVGTGSEVTLAAALDPETSPAPTLLQWQRSSDAGATWTDVDGATGLGYTFTAQRADSGARYRLAADNGVPPQRVVDTGAPVPTMTYSTIATLTVSDPQAPVITRQPDSSAMSDFADAKGQSATASVEASGYPAVAYEWQQSADGEDWTAVPGATGASLSVADPTAAQDGMRYRVRVSNTEGEVLSDVVTLTAATAAGRAALVTPQSVDPAAATTLRVAGVGFRGAGASWPVLRFGLFEAGDVPAGGAPDATKAVSNVLSRPGAVLKTNDGGFSGLGLTVPAGSLDPAKSYVVAFFSSDASVRDYDLVVPVVVAVPEPERISTTASFEWAINAASQGASANGACSFFVAGIADGTEATYKTTDEDLTIIKRGLNGQAIEVTPENRCAPVDGADGAQRALFQDGVATRDPSGVVTVQWTGAFTVYSYGGLVPWYVKDPKLTVSTDGTARVEAELGGLASSMADPNVKVPLDPEPDMTILELEDVSIGGDGVISSTPVWAGADYYPLTDRNDPTSARQSDSAIPQSAKDADPDWGSWPRDLVDFHYRTGLSTYWHTSGGVADPQKPPTPVGLALEGAPLVYTPFDPVTITAQPASVDAIIGGDAAFDVAAESARPLTYQWQIRDDASSAWSDIDGATGPHLVLTDLPQTTKWVQVVVSNDIQRITSASARVRALPAAAPVVTAQPADVIQYVGGTASLSALGSGYPSLSYQWQRSTDGGATWTDVGGPQPIGGLSLGAVTPDLDGSLYRAVIDNGVGEPAITRSASVTVLAADGPTISLADLSASGFAFPLDPVAGGRLFIRGGGFPTPNTVAKIVFGVVEAATWASRGADFGQADLIVSGSYATSSYVQGGIINSLNLKVDPGRLDAAKEYVAVVLSPTAGDRSLDAATPLRLVGQAAPSITTQPADVTAPAVPSEGSAVAVFEVAATGAPTPAVQWQRRAAGGEWEDVAGATSASYVRAYTRADDGSSYRAVLTNALGEVATSHAATLTVGDRAVASVPVATLALAHGEALRIPGSVSGTGAVARWQVLQPGADRWTDVAGAGEPVLTVAAADVRHGQQYRLVVSSPIPALPGGPAETVVSSPVSISVSAPSVAPLEVADAELGPEGGVDLTPTSDTTFSVYVGVEHAGEYAAVWVHSTPQSLGWFLVGTDGRITVTLPAGLEAGVHSLIVLDAAGAVIGWAAVEVTADTAAALAATGSDAPVPAIAGAAAVLLLLGAVVVAVGARRRRHEAPTGRFR